jgi:hypothetical protein
MRVLEIPVFQFSELSDDAKAKALDANRIVESTHFDGEGTIEDAKEIGAILGIEIDKIYYSGFWSQGDGACFEGSYTYKAGSEKAIKEYAPLDKDLHNIARDLRLASASHFYRLKTSVTHRGHYYHKFCTVIDSWNKETGNEVESDAIAEALRDFMDWIYKQLQADYDYRTSDGTIIEMIEANDYEFYEDGRLA